MATVVVACMHACLSVRACVVTCTISGKKNPWIVTCRNWLITYCSINHPLFVRRHCLAQSLCLRDSSRPVRFGVDCRCFTTRLPNRRKSLPANISSAHTHFSFHCRGRVVEHLTEVNALAPTPRAGQRGSHEVGGASESLRTSVTA